MGEAMLLNRVSDDLGIEETVTYLSIMVSPLALVMEVIVGRRWRDSCLRLVMPLSLLKEELDLLALWLFEKLLLELSWRLEEENMLMISEGCFGKDSFKLLNDRIAGLFYTRWADNEVDGEAGRDRTRQQKNEADERRRRKNIVGYFGKLKPTSGSNSDWK